MADHRQQVRGVRTGSDVRPAGLRALAATATWAVTLLGTAPARRRARRVTGCPRGRPGRAGHLGGRRRRVRPGHARLVGARHTLAVAAQVRQTIGPAGPAGRHYPPRRRLGHRAEPSSGGWPRPPGRRPGDRAGPGTPPSTDRPPATPPRGGDGRDRPGRRPSGRADRGGRAARRHPLVAGHPATTGPRRPAGTPRRGGCPGRAGGTPAARSSAPTPT